ncbi:SymE family type I addiction module toxin [Pantoea agglomerans]|uniref:SymE family type I addiction module toxin n=1 Tax=Enterobacter agglomerans TaxID=549 RepID=UPI003C7B82F6
MEHSVPQARKNVNGYRTNDGRPNPLPRLTIKEKWLEQLRFNTGQRIEVITEPEQLIIRLVTEA